MKRVFYSGGGKCSDGMHHLLTGDFRNFHQVFFAWPVASLTVLIWFSIDGHGERMAIVKGAYPRRAAAHSIAAMICSMSHEATGAFRSTSSGGRRP
jgi:hypothetical protein